MLQAQTFGIFESLLHLGRTLLQHNERTGQTMPAAAHKGSFHGLMGSNGGAEAVQIGTVKTCSLATRARRKTLA